MEKSKLAYLEEAAVRVSIPGILSYGKGPKTNCIMDK